VYIPVHRAALLVCRAAYAHMSSHCSPLNFSSSSVVLVSFTERSPLRTVHTVTLFFTPILCL